MAEKQLGVFWSERSLFRRIFERLDLGHVVDLACGHGRHTAQFVDRAGHVTLIDVHESNIEVCRRRLRHCGNVTFIVNNGYDFQPIGDGEVTAIFCYDAMVHFSPEIVASYLVDTKRVLQRDGFALYHHSNYPAPTDRYGMNPGARNHMTQDLFRSLAERAQLTLVESHVIPWGGVDALDCVTLVQNAAGASRT